MCNCIKEVTKKLSKEFVADTESTHKIWAWLNKGIFSNMGYAAKPEKIAMQFILDYREELKSGGPSHAVIRRTEFIYPTFCPFCGEKFES